MSDEYRAAGVDIAAGNEAARRYARLAAETRRPEVMAAIGGFSGGFRIDVNRFPQPVLLSGADGVGTKLKLAFATGRHGTIGIDCVAMCVNDILTSGAEPLFFLDYLATGKLDVEVAEAVVAGVTVGCRTAGCALLGGETAEMPGMYAPGEYDLAGFAVGVANQPDIIDGHRVQAGDALIGLASDGLHSNGYSLVRKLIAEAGVQLADPLPFPAARGPELLGATAAKRPWTWADELLWPTRIYVRPVLAALADGIDIRAMAHITGGGLVENVPRSLPDGLTAEIRVGRWPVPPVFSWLLAQSGMDLASAARVWNLGVGYTLVVPEEQADAAVNWFAEQGERAYRIGRIVAGSGNARLVEEGGR
ncbi:phosphoribosylformylglycinamidine cyclo-ligase [Alicyclobacillus shizuokensis]|uniref:phosphoribosylformylglycinamidine cyclo-ligase n=1 Tax=Alicyclobacillus shizuokensis TaxID=392014 RepID=UPI00082DB5DD|nr:phosphoribosylformylglycinamidine cyclo-ligase [Alicyclobacillus shizuokensis]MCL6625618.1 phosphoribosylformylglycinamidine cyclo-ligase [Alicyclobacillus shizuokensis]